MDIKVSQKAEMWQPKGLVDVIVSGINDFFLVESVDEFGQKWIEDVESIDDFLEEEKDRVEFAVLRQRGQDPIAPFEGIQWAEALLQEIPIPLLMQQITDSAIAESSFVGVSFDTMTINGQEQLAIRFSMVGV